MDCTSSSIIYKEKCWNCENVCHCQPEKLLVLTKSLNDLMKKLWVCHNQHAAPPVCSWFIPHTAPPHGFCVALSMRYVNLCCIVYGNAWHLLNGRVTVTATFRQWKVGFCYISSSAVWFRLCVIVKCVDPSRSCIMPFSSCWHNLHGL